MPAQLDEEEVEEILDTFEEHDSCREAADELPHHYKTVTKYVKQAYDEGDPRVEHFDAKDEFDDSGQWDGAGPGVSPFGEEDDIDLDRDYVGMGPGDFLEEFFGDFEVGVKRSWVRIQARRADRRGMIPTKESIKKDILRMKSGIAGSAHQEAEYIADEYWAEAQEYIRKTGGQVDAQAMSNENATGQPQGMGAGGVNTNGQGFVSPTQGQQQPQQAANPQMQMMQMMMEQMKTMNKEMRKMHQSARGGGGDADTLDRLKELKQEKEILEELSGGDDRLEQVQRQMQQLQAQAMDGDGGQGPTPMGGDASIEDRLLDLAAKDPDVSAQDILDVIEDRMEAEQDPALIEAEKEYDLRKMELEQKQDRYERFGEVFENVAAKVGEGFASSLTEPSSSDEAGGGDQQDEQVVADGSAQADSSMDGAPPTDATTMDVQTQTCKHCDSEMQVTNNSALCPVCEYGVGPCDLCGFPVEIPPAGEANYARCGECDEIVEVPDDPDDPVTCEECEWEGEGDELRGELLECDNCGEMRPIVRQPDPDEQHEHLENILEG